MKKIVLLSIGAAAFILQNISAQAQLVDSWENSTEGWGIVEPTIWANGGFNSTTGVTQGTWSWVLTASASPDYGTALGGTASTTLTAELANAASISVDVLTAPASFSFQQWSVAFNQNSGFGFQSVDGFTYSQSPVIGTESTLTWTVPQSFRNAMIANPTLPTSLNFLIGGGGTGTMEIDDLRITPAPEPGTMALFGLGALGLLKFGRRRS